MTRSHASAVPASRAQRPWSRRVAVVGCSMPLGVMVWNALTGGLGANPINEVIRFTGVWSLALLVVTLSLAPVGRLLHWGGAIAGRRVCGLFAFFYAVLHTATYVGLDQFFSVTAIAADVVKRPHVTAGWISFALLSPLAITSIGRIADRIGERRWHRVHQLVYPAAVIGLAHYFLAVKVDTRAPLIYAAIVTVLLASRVWYLLPTRDRRTARSPRRSAPRPDSNEP